MEVANKIHPAKLERIADILRVIAHPVRLEILELLKEYGELSVAKLQEALAREQAQISQHLIKMKDKRILASRRDGRRIYYRIAIPELLEVLRCMQRCNIEY